MSDMRFKITIEKIETVEEERQEWKVTGSEPVLETWGAKSGTAVRIEDGSVQMKDTYGYTPAIIKYENKTTKIYEQIVTNLNLGKVISAVNLPDNGADANVKN